MKNKLIDESLNLYLTLPIFFRHIMAKVAVGKNIDEIFLTNGRHIHAIKILCYTE